MRALHSHTYCQVAQTTLQPKLGKKCVCPNARTERHCSKFKRIKTTDNLTPVHNKGCNQFGLNGLGKRVGTQGTF